MRDEDTSQALLPVDVPLLVLPTHLGVASVRGLGETSLAKDLLSQAGLPVMVESLTPLQVE